MQKTLGGDRLGSGKKMKVDLHNYERSTHDLGYVFKTTMSAGTLVPFMSELALPGDTFDINLGCDVKTHPTIAPLFGSYKVQLDVFIAPIRLYNGNLHNNQLGIGLNMSNIYLPKITMTTVAQILDIGSTIDLNNAQTNPSCLLRYLGIAGIGYSYPTNAPRKFNAIPILAYWEIYKNYYANKQEEIGAVLHTPGETNIETINTVDLFIPPSTTIALAEFAVTSAIMTLGSSFGIIFTGTEPIPSQVIVTTLEHGDQTLDALSTGVWTLSSGALYSPFRYTYWGQTTIISWRYRDLSDINTGKPKVATFPLSNIDEMRKEVLWATDTEFIINVPNLEPYKWLYETPNDIYNNLSSQEGLALKTYQSDLFNNWLKTENIDAINTATAIDVTSGSFGFDQLILQKKLYMMLNRIAVSGGSYDDWIDAVWTHERYKKVESPMYVGGLIKELVFQEIVSNSQSIDQPLGTLAGKGTMASKHKGGTIVIHVDEPSYIIGIVSITPRIDYSQGNKWDMNLNTMDDIKKPGLDEIGFQELITEQMAWWSTTWDGTKWVQKSAGKQPAWLNYMTNVNRSFGNFAIETNEMFMTLNRRYERTAGEAEIEDLTTYIDPSKFNFIFAQTALDAQNFWTIIGVDIIARRKMSAKIMPNL